MHNTFIARLGRGGFVAIALTLTGQTATAGVFGTAYFSLEGDINAVGDQYDFTFDLTRSVGSGEVLQFETHSEQGGTNAAGDTIAGSNFDSDLRLFNGVNTQIAQSDEIAALDYDALLSWAGVQTDPNGTPMPSPLGADSYRLNLQEYGNSTTGPFAVDLVGPADAMVFTGGSPVSGGTVNSLKFGSNDGSVATYNHSAGTFTLLGELVVAQTGGAVLNLSGGTITAGGLTTIMSGGSVSQTGGTLNANGGLLIDGGSYTRSAGIYNNPGALTVQNGGLFQWEGSPLTGVNLGSSVLVTGTGSTLRVRDAAAIDNTLYVNNSLQYDATLGGTIDVEYLWIQEGTVTIDGPGSTLDASGGDNAGFTHSVGQGPGVSTLTLSNDATGSFVSTVATDLNVGMNSGSTANVNVLTGADLTLQSLDMNTAGTSTVTVDGSGSTITQTAGSVLTVGSGTGSTGTLNVQNSGIFNASNTGTLNVNATGNLNADSGTFNANGAAVGNPGGTLNTSGTVNVTGSGLVNLNGKGVADKYDPGMGGAGGTVNATGGTIDLSGTGKIRANGGRSGDDNRIGPVGGTFTITGGAAVNAVDTSQIQLIGGQGGADPPFNNSGRTGGVGGTMTVTNGSLTLGDSSKLNLDGGLGGEVSTIGNNVDGTGGMGGKLNVNGGNVLINDNATVSLGGGNSPNSPRGTTGDGGAGGQLLVSTGSMTVNGGLVSLDGGAGFGSGTNGAHGLIDITGGTFEMNGGEVFTGTFQRSGVGAFNHNDGKLTVSGGTFNPGVASYAINGPSAVELPTLVLTDGATAPGVTSSFIVGNDNRGRFELLNGATLSSTEVDLGNTPAGMGQALVDGAGSFWNVSGGNALAVGEDGTGELTVTNDGGVSTTIYFIVGRRSASNGTVHIGSGGSVVATNASRQMVIGESGTGVVNVNAGGSVSSATHVRIATFASGNGTLNVNGTGATFTANASLNVGGWEGGPGGTGLLTVANNAQVNIADTLANYAGGTVNLSGGTLSADTIDHSHGGTFDFTGGTLHVETFTGTLDQQGGTLAPGSSAGKTVITGDYGLTAGTLEIELGGTNAGVDFDQVEVLGNAQLFGDLDVSLINGFVPTYGDSFMFLFAWGGVTDAFSSISLPAVPIPNAAWNLFNDGNVIFLNLNSTLAGDLNNDGFVGIADLNLVLGNWNQNVTPGDPLLGDPSGDGFVGIADLNEVLGNWNAGTPPPPVNTSASIPEPATGALLALGALVLGRRGGKRQTP